MRSDYGSGPGNLCHFTVMVNMGDKVVWMEFITMIKVTCFAS